MNNISSISSLSASVRIYRTLLAAYPKKFREHYETHMVQVFRDSIREAYHHNGIPGVVDLWIHTLFDLVFTALNERISERSQFMFSPKVILWGGVASALGGLCWLMTGLAPSSGAATILLALVLGLGGLVSLYSRQARQGVKLGLAGFALGVVGTVAALAAFWWVYSVIYSVPSRAAVNLQFEREGAQSFLVSSLAFLTLGIGLALLGVASLRGQTLPRWQGLPLTLGLLNILLGISSWLIIYVPLSQGRNPFEPWPPEGYAFIVAEFVLLGLGWIGLGTVLASEGDAQIPVAQPPSTSA